MTTLKDLIDVTNTKIQNGRKYVDSNTRLFINENEYLQLRKNEVWISQPVSVEKVDTGLNITCVYFALH